MTPLHLKILLHYFCSTATVYGSHNHAHATSQSTLDYTAELNTMGLIEPSDTPSGWKTTDRGDVFCRAVLATPLPVQKWVMP